MVVVLDIVVVVLKVGIIWFDAVNCNIESQVLRTPVIPSKCPLFLSNPWQAYKLLLLTWPASWLFNVTDIPFLKSLDLSYQVVHFV